MSVYYHICEYGFSLYILAVFRLLEYTGIYSQHWQYTLSGFHATGSISGFPIVRGTAGTALLGECFTRIYCSISGLDRCSGDTLQYSQYLALSSTAHILPVLAVSRTTHTRVLQYSQCQQCPEYRTPKYCQHRQRQEYRTSYHFNGWFLIHLRHSNHPVSYVAAA